MQGIAFLFPGQGSQYVGMGRDLYEEFKSVRETFEEANEVLGFDLTKLCFEGDLAELTKTENAQPAILTSSIACFRAFMEVVNQVPEYVAGHSLGEYSALVAAGALKFADAVRLVNKRGKFMQEAVPIGVGSMLAVIKIKKSLVDGVCEQISKPDSLVAVANYNSSEQCVISGNKEAVELAGKELEKLGALVKPLQVSAPFHSPLMQSAADKMFEELLSLEPGTAKWPVISNVTALPYRITNNLVNDLTRQITHPVRWQETMAYLHNQRISYVIEMGPKAVLTNLMKKSYQDIKAFNFETKEELQTIAEQLPKPNFKKVVSKAIATIVCTQNRNFDDEEYKVGVIEPYRKIETFNQSLEVENREPTLEELGEILLSVKNILIAKKVSEVELKQRIADILNLTGTQQYFTDFMSQT